MAAKARRAFRMIGSGRFNWDIASTAAGAQSTTTVNIPEAKVGDVVVATPDAAQAGFLYDGTVTGPSTVTLRAINAGSTSADPGPAAVAVLVLRA